MHERDALVPLVASLASLLLTAPSHAATWVIHPDGTGDAPTIQAGIDAAVDTDIIELVDGTFLGPGNRDIDFGGKAVTVRSQSGDATVCIIDCQGTPADPHRGFHFHSGETDASVVEGLTIRGGFAPGVDASGGGILCEASSSPLIRACVLTENEAANAGGGLKCATGASPRIETCTLSGNTAIVGGAADCTDPVTFIDCQFLDNMAGQVGGALRIEGGATVSGSTFAGNQAAYGGALDCLGSTPTFDFCVFFENSAEFGGAIFCPHVACQTTLTSCTLAGNSATYGGGIYSMSAAGPVVRQTIVAFSTSGAGVECFMEGAVSLQCSDVFGNAGGDWVGCIASQAKINQNFSADPLFCDLAGGDLGLFSNSPCLPSPPGEGPCELLVGAFGEECSSPSSADATQEISSWGRVKLRYRGEGR
jgi:predicted outer membrane repeat protein